MINTAAAEWMSKYGFELQTKRKWSVFCPQCGHDRTKWDTKSLVVYRDPDGWVRWQCYHPGCAWNTRQYDGDPFPGSFKVSTASVESDWVPTYQNLTDPLYELPCANGGDQLWWYKDKEGRPLYAVLRKNYDNGKAYFPYTAVEISTGDVTEVIIKSLPHWPPVKTFYGTETLTNRGTVLIVEGEKAADKARELFKEVTTLTWRGGSGNIHTADWDILEGRTVYLWPDNDEPGRKAMTQIAELLSNSKVYWIDSSWMSAGGDAGDLTKDDVEMAYEWIRKAEMING